MNKKSFNLALNNMGLQFNNSKNNNFSVGTPKLYIISLEKNKELNNYFNKNKIDDTNFIEINEEKDFEKLSDGDIIFVLSSKKNYEKYENKINIVKEHNNSAVVPITSLENFELIFEFLQKLTEIIIIPCLVGLDFADIKEILNTGDNIILKKYEIYFKKKIIIPEKLVFDLKEVNACLAVFSVGLNIKLDDIHNLENEIYKYVENFVFGCSMSNKNLKEKIELYLFIIK